MAGYIGGARLGLAISGGAQGGRVGINVYKYAEGPGVRAAGLFAGECAGRLRACAARDFLPARDTPEGHDHTQLWELAEKQLGPLRWWSVIRKRRARNWLIEARERAYTWLEGRWAAVQQIAAVLESRGFVIGVEIADVCRRTGCPRQVPVEFEDVQLLTMHLVMRRRISSGVGQAIDAIHDARRLSDPQYDGHFR